MTSPEVLARLAEIRVIPVVEIDHARDAVSLASTLVDAGLPVVELTLRTPGALEAIESVATECPEILLGAGTLLSADMVSAASGAGAQFGVSPGVHVSSITAAADLSLPFVPGVVTPTDILTALDAGLRHLKFFPAGAYGGKAMLSALAGPVSATGVRFMPTGGITAVNACQYLALPAVFAVGGTWIAPRADIAAGLWDDIAARARAARELVHSSEQENLA